MLASTVFSSPAALLRSRIQNRTAHVGIIGLGYVGLPLALLLTEERFPVTGFDIDAKKVDVLSEGGSYIYRIPATEIKMARDHGLKATTNYSELTGMDAIIICVPTPLNEHGNPTFRISPARWSPSHLTYNRDSWWFLRAQLIPARLKKSWSLFWRARIHAR